MTSAPSPPSAATVPQDVLRDTVAFYLDLHAHPELSGDERRTAEAFARRLAREGCTVTRGVGGHGVVGVLANGPGPTVLLRAELDALPVPEETGLPYASTVPGVMHACGHDLHLAALAGAVTVLARDRSGWSGTLLVVGQPSEETLSGARAMLADGLYERFGTPHVALAQHTAPLPAGTVAHVAAGAPVLAGGVTLDVVVHGRGGHAGAPHLTVDPVLTAAAVVMRLQGVVARETAPAEQVVLTVGALHAGERANVVPDAARLAIGVRGFTEAALDRVTEAVRRIVRAESTASGCPAEPTLSVDSRSPALVPDPGTTDALRGVHTDVLGAARVLTWHPATATEDFAWYGPAGAALHGVRHVRTGYWMLGATGVREWRAAGDRPGGPPGNHSPHFAPDVRTALPAGVRALVSAARHELAGGRPRAEDGDEGRA
ncbi:amidohydrolase [Streptomyces chumphonensis]|uniref:Amidohydrolase n=1 Tax=Streptomyces chumphonensis TaxID=1214925 RepID=A0A927F037_9ACTN|nr:amidohydrolase [Streptomyces chumphonensis]MBD3931804.1 amidohydrolase [Streptomyces chumphonensis]